MDMCLVRSIDPASEAVAADARRPWISSPGPPWRPRPQVVPLAYRVARRVRRSQEDRERFLQRAIDSSDLERRRIAADLHDGTVQQLAGLSMSLAATADALEQRDPTASRALRDAADATRLGVRSLRSAVMGIHPPDLQRAGLRAGFADLTAPLADDGIQTDVHVPADLILPARSSPAVPRLSRSDPHIWRARPACSAGWPKPIEVMLEIVDDGSSTPRRRPSERLGLTLPDDPARDVGGGPADSRRGAARSFD
jgi:signal transduction histidine kinase